MRLFELLTILTLVPFVVAPLFKKRPFWINYIPFVAGIFALLSLAIEQYRWQMFPAYLLLFICILIAILNIRRRKDYGRSWLTILAAIVGMVWIFIAFAIPIALPVPQFIETTGPYGIGTESYYLVDESREEIYTAENGDPRELMAQIWYPTEKDASGTAAPYLDALDVAGPVLAQQFELPSFLLEHINLADTGTLSDVPVANGDEPFPIILFSHGLTGIRGQNTAMVRELVSHGYVVAAVDHTYANALSVFPDGRVILYDPKRVFASGQANPVEGVQLVQVWAADLGFLLDQLTNWSEEEGHLLNGRLDVDNVGVFGHSTGGGTTLRFCLDDNRCRAGAPLDSWVLPVGEDVLTTPPTQPFLFINTPEWLGPFNQERGRAIFDVLPNAGYELTLAETGHYDFTDIPLLTPLTPQIGLSGGIDAEYSLRLQNEYLLAFFNRYLKNEAAPLLEEASPYPELSIERN